MKSNNKQNSGTVGGRIQYNFALGQAQRDESPLYLTPRIQDFKLPWAEQTAALSRTEPVDRLNEPRIVPFEVVCEQIRQRNEAKTAILQEVLQRSEGFQHRFWGIN